MRFSFPSNIASIIFNDFLENAVTIVYNRLKVSHDSWATLPISFSNCNLFCFERICLTKGLVICQYIVSIHNLDIWGRDRNVRKISGKSETSEWTLSIDIEGQATIWGLQCKVSPKVVLGQSHIVVLAREMRLKVEINCATQLHLSA